MIPQTRSFLLIHMRRTFVRRQMEIFPLMLFTDIFVLIGSIAILYLFLSLENGLF